jgi:hypothetical protein
MPKKTTLRKKLNEPSPGLVARKSVADVDFRPDVTDLDVDEVIKAYIEHEVNADSRPDMRKLVQTIEALEKKIKAALPEDLQSAVAELADKRSDERWLSLEAGYMLGVEVGRRLGGAR